MRWLVLNLDEGYFFKKTRKNFLVWKKRKLKIVIFGELMVRSMEQVIENRLKDGLRILNGSTTNNTLYIIMFVFMPILLLTMLIILIWLICKSKTP